MKIKVQIIISCFVCFSFFNVFAEDAPKITLRPNCQTFYAGREHTLTVAADKLTGERLSWNLRYLGRTLAAGQRQIPANGEVKITFNFPELNEGVVAEVEFSCFVGGKGPKGQRAKAEKANREEGESGSQKQNTEIKKKLYFFYPNPFVGQKKAFKKLKIGVWEPSEGEALSKLLTELALPFAKLADISGFDGEVLLLSGLDFDENPGVAETLLKIVKKGKKVIVLPPFSGTFTGFSEEINELRLTNNSTIQEFNKKFDSNNWNGKAITTSSMKLTPLDEAVSLEVKENIKGFSFCEIRRNGGTMILTTWDIVKGAKASPTPVYLLKMMISATEYRVNSRK